MNKFIHLPSTQWKVTKADIEEEIKILFSHDCSGVTGHCPICRKVVQLEMKLRNLK